MISFLWSCSFSTNSSPHPYSNFISDFFLLSQFKWAKFTINLYRTVKALGASHSENLEKTQLQSALKPNQINYGFVPVHFGNILDITQRCIHSHTHTLTHSDAQINKFWHKHVCTCMHMCVWDRERETDRQWNRERQRERNKTVTKPRKNVKEIKKGLCSSFAMFKYLQITL